MYLSMYTLYRGDLTLYNEKKIDVEFRSIITLPHSIFCIILKKRG